MLVICVRVGPNAGWRQVSRFRSQVFNSRLVTKVTCAYIGYLLSIRISARRSLPITEQMVLRSDSTSNDKSAAEDARANTIRISDNDSFFQLSFL
jgi:hypothetical protein